jgi:hypothetical protein
MTPTFVEELFLRIEERLNALEIDMQSLKSELSSIYRDLSKLKEFHDELVSIKRFMKFGRGVVLVIWGFAVTAINVLISKWLNVL